MKINQGKYIFDRYLCYKLSHIIMYIWVGLYWYSFDEHRNNFAWSQENFFNLLATRRLMETVSTEPKISSWYLPLTSCKWQQYIQKIFCQAWKFPSRGLLYWIVMNVLLQGIHKCSDKFSFYVAGSIKLDWSNCGEVLAVGGFTRLPNLQCQNEIHFYTKEGQLLHRVYLPCQVKFNMWN